MNAWSCEAKSMRMNKVPWSKEVGFMILKRERERVRTGCFQNRWNA